MIANHTIIQLSIKIFITSIKNDLVNCISNGQIDEQIDNLENQYIFGIYRSENRLWCQNMMYRNSTAQYGNPFQTFSTNLLFSHVRVYLRKKSAFFLRNHLQLFTESVTVCGMDFCVKKVEIKEVLLVSVAITEKDKLTEFSRSS